MRRFLRRRVLGPSAGGLPSCVSWVQEVKRPPARAAWWGAYRGAASIAIVVCGARSSEGAGKGGVTPCRRASIQAWPKPRTRSATPAISAHRIS